RVRRVARDRERLDSRLLQLRSPVTQELELARSGRGPVEEIEEEEQRAVVDEVADARPLAWRRPHHRLERRLLPDLQHELDATRRPPAPARVPLRWPPRSPAPPRRCRGSR